ncbi:MAG: DUF1284 domain-containing protein [Clostridia bacterium]|nr:DUF1284 domain-containing protein [Clostridia bacterium]
MVKLRPHHILCIAHYEGNGYSEEFNLKMKEIIKRLETGEEFELVFGADDLCSSCPNLKNGICKTEKKVNRYDSMTAEMLSIFEGQISTKVIFELAKEKIYRENRFNLICSDCEWSYICRKNEKQYYYKPIHSHLSFPHLF